MSRKRLLILLGLGLLISQASSGQDQQALKSGSTDSKLLPNQSGNTNSGSVFSPDLFNGTANINIPIYDGVSLSYNTAGIKVDEPAGLIGQHWNLNAGGSITRSMKDVPDEMSVSINQIPSLEGSGDPAVASGIKGKFCQYGLADNSGLDMNSYVDDESDDFIFSVGNFSFTFNIGNNGFIFTNPHKNIKIDLLLNGQVINTNNQIPNSGSYYSLPEINFRVRDAQGNWYYFKKGDLSHIEYGPKGFSTLAYDYISKWVLTSIVANDGKVTQYTYTTQGASSSILYAAFTSSEPANSIDGISSLDNASVSASENLSYYSRLESISYPDKANVSFIYSVPPGGRCDMTNVDPLMSEIQVNSFDATTRYVFEQAYAVAKNENYFGTAPPLTVAETPISACVTVGLNGQAGYRFHRLILKGIHIANADGTKTEPFYKFGYNRSSSFRLPAKLNNGQDYFGYYNGKTIMTSWGDLMNIPNHQNMYSTGAWPYGVDRSDDWNYAQADLLNLMVNAYGGQTTFYYGPHELTNQLANAFITAPTDVYFMGANANDGVRLDSIIKDDPDYPGIWQVERFGYVGGQRFTPGGYFHFPIDNTYPTQPTVLFNATYVTPHQFINGSNHGYTTVSDTTFSQTNLTYQRLSIETTTFRNISRGTNITSYYNTGAKQFFQIPYTDKQYIKDWEIGLPLVTLGYDGLGNILSRTTNTYADVLDATTAIGNVENLKRLTTNLNGVVKTVDSEFYHPYTGITLLTQTVTQKFVDGTTSINDTVSYTYDDHNNLASTIAQNSLGEHFSVNNIYNYNVDGPGMLSNHPGTTIYNMTSEGLEVRIGMERWKPGSTIYNNTLYDANITKYYYQNGLLSAQKQYALQARDPITFTAYTGISTGSPNINQYNNILTAYNYPTQAIPNFQVASEVLQFDLKNNPVETQLKGQNSYISMMWDTTNYKKIVNVQNARLVDIGYTSFEHFPGFSYGAGATTIDGGFTFNDQGHTEGYGSISGTSCFKLLSSGPSIYIKSPALTAGKAYIMTYWAKPLTGTAVPSASYLVGGTPTALIVIPQYTAPNGWVNYRIEYTPTQTGNIQLTTNNAAYIDEVRFFPAGAMMKSWVFTPLLGATSSTDPAGRVTYYEYDAFGRLIDTKDQEGHVISKKEYQIAQ